MRAWVPAALVAALMLLAVMPTISFDSYAPGETGDAGGSSSGDTSTTAETFTLTGDLKCWDTSAGTDPINVIIIAGHRDTSTSTSASSETWYYDSDPIEATGTWMEPGEGETEGHWTFSEQVPVLQAGYSYFICVQDGYRIFEAPFDTIATTSTDLKPGTADYTLTFTARQIIAVGTANDEIDLTENQMIQLRPAMVNVSGLVISGEDYALSNVEIRLAKSDNPDRVLYTTYTDYNGRFTFSNVYTGHYIISASVAGYSYDSTPVDIQDNSTNSYRLIMTQQSDTQYFGFDLPHFLMIVGGIICIVLIVVSILFQHRVRKGRMGDWINDDTEEED